MSTPPRSDLQPASSSNSVSSGDAQSHIAGTSSAWNRPSAVSTSPGDAALATTPFSVFEQMPVTTP
jgi:hypothetical protein